MINATADHFTIIIAKMLDQCQHGMRLSA